MAFFQFHVPDSVENEDTGMQCVHSLFQAKSCLLYQGPKGVCFFLAMGYVTCLNEGPSARELSIHSCYFSCYLKQNVLVKIPHSKDRLMYSFKSEDQI